MNQNWALKTSFSRQMDTTLLVHTNTCNGKKMSMPGVVTHRRREDDKLEAILSYTVTFYLKKISRLDVELSGRAPT